jgi:hypothetical protein
MATSAAAAAVIRKERELIEHFRDAGAVSPSTARSPADLGVHERFAWIRLVERGVIREAESGKYYFHEPTWVTVRQRRRRLTLVMLLVVCVALAIALLFTTGSAFRR